MTEGARVDFYQLSRDPVERVLPQVAARILDEGARLLVVSSDRDQLVRISARLWDAGPESFLANDHADAPLPEVQPILLSSTCAATNGATRIALTDGLFRDEALAFARIFYFFDADTITAARESWRTLAKRDDIATHFWRQEGGRWRQGP
ncbi:DNA polymerase III subunit chi [Sphingobium sufflavum]|uniref:DNA polymerase III subunit chi n=1 Tax=Sphingobium sufflavum TaxID=1129547 RepID=UPI001F1F1805|nr:DNA polymerase III subunit chi [Sphingobium sufflavum]MCE7797779.1 DNA polymerase III subunit chi [Sphingobium sufflavum]